MSDAPKKIDAGKTMAEMWEGFAEAVIPFVPPSSVQYVEMKKTFFAGGFCLFNWFMVQLDEGDDPTEGDLDKVSAMDREIREFLEAAGGERSIQ